MSGTTPISSSGIKDAGNTAEEQVISPTERDFALTIALQKTEWQKIKGVKPILFTLVRSGRSIAGVLFISATDEIVADQKEYTFRINGKNVDDLVEIYATTQAAIYATGTKASKDGEKKQKDGRSDQSSADQAAGRSTGVS